MVWAISALVALGYKLPVANKMVRAVLEEGMDTEQVIKAALQASARK